MKLGRVLRGGSRRLLPIAATILLAGLFRPCFAQLEGDTIPVSKVHPVPAVQDTETAAQRDARMKWWRESRYGMLITWGLYSVPAGTWHGKSVPGIGEWIMNYASIPVAEYKGIAPQFNPTAYSAHDIVALAKAAGMKYIIAMPKHHDGFAMFDSKADPFNIVAATPFKRDPLAELAAECKKQGMKLGFYYSQDQDWTAPGGAAIMWDHHDRPHHHWDPAQDGDFATYLRTKAIPQLKELLTNYGDAPAVIWFDTPTEDMTPALASEIVKLLNQHPKLIWNNRLGGGYAGDTDTPEQFIPPQGYPGRDWEACMTINGTWGYKSDDMDFKSPELLLRNLIDIASKGGNYLVNIGPDGRGAVPQAEAERLRQVGAWLKVNGEAIYGTTATLFGAEAGSYSATEKNDRGKPKFIESWDWRSTTAKDKIYIELMKWPNGTFHLPKSPRKITGAYLLADPKHKPLKISVSGDGTDVALPAKALDPVATVLVLRTE
jgi:alpha-L-fucosidase